MSEMNCNFFAEPLPCTWWLYFWENIFILGPKSVSSFSCNIQQQTCLLKLVSAIFSEIFIFHQTVALQKLWKMFFISSTKLFSFSRYSNLCIFSPCQPFLESLIQDKSQSLWRLQLTKEQLKNTFCLISWEEKKGMTLKLWPLIWY